MQSDLDVYHILSSYYKASPVSEAVFHAYIKQNIKEYKKHWNTIHQGIIDHYNLKNISFTTIPNVTVYAHNWNNWRIFNGMNGLQFSS
jgi:hypothetical protein